MADTQPETHEVDKPEQMRGKIVYGPSAFKLLTPRILAKVTKSLRYFCVGLMGIVSATNTFSGSQAKIIGTVLSITILALGSVDLGIGVEPKKDSSPS